MKPNNRKADLVTMAMRGPPLCGRLGPHYVGVLGVESLAQIGHRRSHVTSKQRLCVTLPPVELTESWIYNQLYIGSEEQGRHRHT